MDQNTETGITLTGMEVDILQTLIARDIATLTEEIQTIEDRLSLATVAADEPSLRAAERWQQTCINTKAILAVMRQRLAGDLDAEATRQQLLALRTKY